VINLKSIYEIIAITAQIIAYIMAIIIIIQIIRFIFGGSWEAQDIVVSLLILNITMIFGLGGYLIQSSHNTNSKISNLNNKIFDVDKKISSHIAWHQGKNNS